MYEVRGSSPGAIGVVVVDANSWKLTLVRAALDTIVIVWHEASPELRLAASAVAASSNVL